MEAVGNTTHREPQNKGKIVDQKAPTHCVGLFLAARVGGLVWRRRCLLSCFALVPMFVGLALGRRVRQHLNEALFRSLLLLFLAAVAVLLALK